MGFHFFCGRFARVWRDPHRCTVFFFPFFELNGFSGFVKLGFFHWAKRRQRSRGLAGINFLCTTFGRSFGRTHRAAIMKDRVLWRLRSYRGWAPEA